MNQDKLLLIILDGWGIGKKDNTDGIYNANTPFFDSLLEKYPWSTLQTFGNAVGLPEGQMGNSEVGHMNIGAGRVVWQQLELINRSFQLGDAAQMQGIIQITQYCLENNKPLHLIGLVSKGGVHSSLDHLIALCKIFSEKGLKEIYIHAFMDGRDTDPQSGVHYIEYLEEAIKETGAKLAGLVGRYYAMDRDQRWERIKIAYDLMVHSMGRKSVSAIEALKESYNQGVTDEFVLPVVLTDESGDPITQIKDGDAVFCFNFRTDRGRQITRALTQEDFHEQNMHKLQIMYSTMTEYDASFVGVNTIFDNKNIPNTLGEILSKNGKKQLRSAETEKYPHVTFFFSGGQETPFPGEDRILENSPKVATYDLMPEMSAIPLTNKLVEALKSNQYDFICHNYANTDMVGHTGVWEAITQAAEAVDSCLERLLKTALEMQYQVIVIADHGNSDEAKNADGTPNTAHSMNPVPCIVISDKVKEVKNGKLADIAPGVLKLINLPTPSEMDGNVIF